MLTNKWCKNTDYDCRPSELPGSISSIQCGYVDVQDILGAGHYLSAGVGGGQFFW